MNPIDLNSYQDGEEGLGQGQVDSSLIPTDNEAAAEAVPVQESEPDSSPESSSVEDGRNFMQGAQDFLAEKLLGRSEEESQALRQEGLDREAAVQEQINQDAGVLPEAVRAVVGGVAGAVESVGEFAELTGDTLKTLTGLGEEEDNPWSDSYEQADWDFGVAENLTGVGKFGREVVSFLTLMRGARALPGVGAVGTGSKAGAAARVGGEALRGAVADLVLSSDGGNLSNLIEEVAPQYKDTWVTALAIDEDDNPWEARLKNVIEGGTLGAAVDGLVELIGAARAGRAAKAAGATDDEAIDAAIDAAKNPTREYPNKQYRTDEAFERGSTRNTDALWNPEERASKPTTFGAEAAYKSQVKAEDFDGVLPVSSSPLLTDRAYEIITNLDDALAQAIARTGSSIDIDALSRELGQSNDETVAKALVAVRDFLGASGESVEDAMKAFEPITFKDINGQVIGSRQAVVAVKTLIKDTAYQINDVATAALDLVEGGADVVTAQVPMLVDRMQALLRLHKTSASHYAGGLQTFKIGPITVGNNAGALSKNLKDIDDKLAALKELAKTGDPESLAEFKRLANAMVLAGGDPTKQVSFLGLFAKVGGREMQTAFFNSILSSPLTQIRNIFGSVATTTLRPMSMAIGHTMMGDITNAKVALGSFHSLGDSFGEAFSVMGASWRHNMPINEGQKFASQTQEAAKELQLLKSTAASPAEKAAVMHLENLHGLVNAPWATLPSRALTAVDDGFKTLVARMELKRKVLAESLDNGANGIKFDADRYAELATKKFGQNGEILDDHLLSVAKEATFQQDLKGFAKGVSDLSNSNGVMKYFVPFIRTPHNIMVYAGTHTPFVGAFLPEARAALKSGDPEQVATMLGRQAIGSMATMHAINMALNDQMTGAGPVDPEKRKIWLQSHQPYSIKVGDRWVSYQSIEPLNMIFAAAADLTQLSNVGSTGAYDKSAAQLAFTIMAATTDKSFFTGLAGLLDFFDPQKLAKGNLLQKTGLDFINNHIPYAGARRQLARALSPGMYEWRNELDKSLAGAIPGYSLFHGVEKIDIFTGEQMLGTMGNVLNNFLPFSITDKKDNKVIQKLSELGINYNVEFSDKLKGIKLLPEDKKRINELMAQEDILGELDRLFNAKWFKADLDKWEAEKLANPTAVVKAEDSRWYEKTVEIFEKVRERAVKRYTSENENFRELYHAQNNARKRGGRGQYDQVQELIELSNR